MKRNKREEANRPKKLYSAKWKLLLIFVFLTSVSLLFIWLTENFYLDKIYIRIKKEELINGCNRLLAAESTESYGEISQELAGSGICVAVYSLDQLSGELKTRGNYYSRPNCNCLVHRLLSYEENSHSGPVGNLQNIRSMETIRKTILNIAEMGGTGYIDPRNDLNAQVVGDDLTWVVLSDQGKEITAFFLNTTVVPLDSTVKTLNEMMLYLSIVVVLCSIFIALAVSIWITQPIEEINRSAKQLAACNYEVKFSGKGYKEIAELSETLNYASAELAKVDNLQKELISNISHDLRTPLTLISGYAEVMRDLPDENTEENLQIIIDESNRMKALVNDVLDISKIKAGTTPMVLAPVQLTNCIESELTRYNKLRDREGYNIEFRYNSLVTVNADYTRLMQVVYNLVNNAVNYTGEDKKVTVTQSVHGEKVRISVTDTGEGIAEEHLPLIWDRYYKVDKTHKRAAVGSGLGLSIVKTIINAHNGTCGVQSKLGQGSTFWFELDILSSSSLSESDLQ